MPPTTKKPISPNIQIVSRKITPVRDDYIEKPQIVGGAANLEETPQVEEKKDENQQNLQDKKQDASKHQKHKSLHSKDKRHHQKGSHKRKYRAKKQLTGAQPRKNADIAIPTEEDQQLMFQIRNAWKRDIKKDPAVALGLLTQDIINEKMMVSQIKTPASRVDKLMAASVADEDQSETTSTYDTKSEIDGMPMAQVHYDLPLANIMAQAAQEEMILMQNEGASPAPKDDPQYIKDIHGRRLHYFSHEVMTFKFDEYYEKKFQRHMGAAPASAESTAPKSSAEAALQQLADVDLAAAVLGNATPTPGTPTEPNPTPSTPSSSASAAPSSANQRYLQESLVPIDNDLNVEHLLMAKYDNILFLCTNFTIFALYCNPTIGKKSYHMQILDSFTFPKEKNSKRLFRSLKHTKKINDLVSNIKSSLPAGSISDKWKVIQDMQAQASEKRLIVLFGGSLYAVDFSSICAKLKQRIYNCQGSLKCYGIQGKKSSNVEMMSINKKNDKLVVIKNAFDKYFQLEMVGSSYTQIGKTLELFVPGTILAIQFVGEYIVLSLSSQYLIVRSDGTTLLNSIKRNKFNFKRWPRYLEDGSQVFTSLISIIGSDKTVYTTAGQDDPNPPSPGLTGPDWGSTQCMGFFYPFVINVQATKIEFYDVYHDKRVDVFEFSNGYDILQDDKHIYTLAKKGTNTHQLLISTPISFYEQKKYLLMNIDFVQGQNSSWPEGPLDRIRDKETLDLHAYHSNILISEVETKYAQDKHKAETKHKALVHSIETEPQFANKPEALQRALDSAKTQYKLDLEHLTQNYTERKASIDVQLQWQMSQIHLLHGVLALHQAKFLPQKKMNKAISEAFEHFKQSTIDVRFLRNYMQKAGEDQELTQNLNSLKILSEIHPERMFLKPEQYDYLIEDKKYYAILRTMSYLPPVSGPASFHAVQEFISFLERRKVMYSNDSSYFTRKMYAQDQLALNEVNVYLKPHQLIELMNEYEKYLENPDIDHDDFSWIEKVLIYPTSERVHEIPRDIDDELADKDASLKTEIIKESKFGAQWVDLYLIFHYGAQRYRDLQPSDRSIKKHIRMLQLLSTLRPGDDLTPEIKKAYVALKMADHAHFLYGYLKLKFGKRKASFFNRLAIFLENYRKKAAQDVLNDETFSIDNYLLLLYGMLQHSNNIPPETRIKYSRQLKKITRGEEWNHWLLHVWGKLGQVEKAKSIDIRISAIRAIFAIPKIYITWRITELTKENMGFNTEEALEEYLMMARKSRDRWIEEIEDCLQNDWEMPPVDEVEVLKLKHIAHYDYFVDTESRFQDKSRKDVIIDACVDMLSRSHCILKRQVLEIITSLIQKICNATKKNDTTDERRALLEEAVQMEQLMKKDTGKQLEILKRRAEGEGSISPMQFLTDMPAPQFSALRDGLPTEQTTAVAIKSHHNEDSMSAIRNHISTIIAQRKLMLPLIKIFIHQNSKFTIGEVLRFLRNTHKLPYSFFSNNHSYHMQIEYLEMIFSDKDLLDKVDEDFIEKYHSVEYQLAQLYVTILGKFVVSGDKKNALIDKYRERFHRLVTSDSFNYKLDSEKKGDLLKILEPFTVGASGKGEGAPTAGLKDELIILHKSLRNHREVLRIMFTGVTERTQYPEVFDQAEAFCVQTFEEEKRSKGFTRALSRNNTNPYFTYMVDVASSLVDRQSPESRQEYTRYIINLLTKRAREISLLDCLDFLPEDWSVDDLGFILKRNLRECEETIRNNQIRERSLSQSKIKKQFELAHLQSRYVVIDKDTECARSNPRENITDVYGEALFVYPSVDVKKHCQQVVKGKNILDSYGQAFPRHVNLVDYRDMRKTPANVKLLVKENLIEQPKQLL